MKKIISTLCLTIILNIPALTVEAFSPNEHQFEIHGEIFPAKIRESYLSRPDNKLEGTMYGVNAAYVLGLGRNFLKINPRYAASKLEHKWHNNVIADRGSAFIFETRGIFGRDVDVYNCISISPYIGLGYTYFNNDAGKKLTLNPWHFAKATHLYVPIGFDLKVGFENCFSLISNLEFDWLMRGTIRTDTFLCKTETTSSDGYGVRFSIGGAVDFSSFSLEVKPFIHFWKIDGKDHRCLSCGLTADPQYQSRMVGISFGVKI